ncbi:ATP-dependent DNA helicase RecG [Thermanaerothrix sp. 4228-RoL]|uniref:ATP-dependent DNA helicase RecG n=2 Tax=Thermanaerothrix TaxID=1077886 RepID=A0ABU3NKC8_9CHLR|nr:ATP-dependent DNA helicase RecG [Thermanaerothrix sp. 4228-RoL]MDT8897279.1 ATP-dependent DNA helicase RecG [Thermanaerothrix sp. 4228-RoL]
MLPALQKLQKFIRLEAERGYDNRAVLGGLDKILPVWQQEAREDGVPEDFIQDVIHCLEGYASYSVPERAECLQTLLIKINNLTASETTATASPQVQPAGISSPSQTQREKSKSSSRSRSRGYTLPADTLPAHGLKAPLTVLPGIGPRYAQTLRQLGLETLEDLLYYFPRRYDDYSRLKPINRLRYGEEVTVIGTVQSVNNRDTRGGRLNLTEVIVSDGTAALRVNWFNQPWLAKSITPGMQIVLSGKVDMYLGRLVMNSPEWEPLEQEHLHTNRIVPVYSLTAKVTQKMLRRIMYQTVSFWAPRIQDYLPEWVRQAGELMPLPRALLNIHFPESHEDLKAAQDRLAFDELFLLQLGVLQQKRAWQANTATIFEVPDSWLESLIFNLPFELTSAQRRVLAEIRDDLRSGRPMNRLLQGDVGSGKTIVAALAIALVTYHGAQAAFMAPTSILAEQHYRNLSRLLSNPENPLLAPDAIRLLVGDTSENEKEAIRAGLADGSVKLVIGTHALIEDPVVFADLELVIIDEQHRFGVEQRAALRLKGNNPHLLVMTATPIPRSLALTIYGDLDLSVMDEMPRGRQPVETHLLSPLERERAYALIRAEIKKGHQAFIIYPLIEKGQNNNNDEAKAAVEEYERLQREIFPDLRLGLLHGRLPPAEKDRIMRAFRNGEFHILVSTSVVEVGVDIPNATVMLIEGANRFGLAQLHQFRGRVGRGQAQSYCLLIPETNDDIENERLLAMVETNDGFLLAERDLQQRGPGEFLGTRQAGYSELRMANLANVHLIEKARHLAQSLFEQDPDLSLPEHQPLRLNFERFWQGGRGDIS